MMFAELANLRQLLPVNASGECSVGKWFGEGEVEPDFVLDLIVGTRVVSGTD